MISILEKILFYTVGGVLGLLISYLLMMFEESPFLNMEVSNVILFSGVVIGVLIFAVIVDYKNKRELRRNINIRNETFALITHEMRTTLTSTNWAIKMFLKKYKSSLDEKDNKMLEGLSDSIDTTAMHSINLLDVSLLDIGKLSIALEDTDLGKVEESLNEAIDKFRVGASRKDINLKSDIKLDNNKHIEADIVRLRIILENLLENAIQYTVGKIKEINVKVSNNDRYLYMDIRDSGIGIPENERDEIFKEFYRAGNARKVLSSGSGIGLYTCLQYVEAHRGNIDFDSEEGRGTTFHVKIPLKRIANVDEFLEKI